MSLFLTASTFLDALLDYTTLKNAPNIPNSFATVFEVLLMFWPFSLFCHNHVLPGNFREIQWCLKGQSWLF